MLTPTELEYLRSLVGHPGYRALLKLIDLADDDLLRKLEGASPDDEGQALSLWRASRRVRRILADDPTALVEAMPPLVE